MVLSGDARANDESPALLLVLRKPAAPGFYVVLLGFGVFSDGGAWLMWSLRHNASTLVSWAALLISLPVALLVGVSISLTFVQHVLHRCWPSRLEGDASVLRVALWNTWNGLLDGFRRTRMAVPRNEIVGVELHIGQARNWGLFLTHTSGLALATGWWGTREEATRMGQAILRWLAAPPVADRERELGERA